MEQIATITRVLEGGRAEVEVRRQSSCGHDCTGCHGCGAPDEHIRVTAINEANAVEGDTVLVTSDSKKILGLAVLLYLVPLVLFFICYLYLGAITGLSGGPNGAIGFLIGITFVYIANHKMMKSSEVVFTVTSVCSNE